MKNRRRIVRLVNKILAVYLLLVAVFAYGVLAREYGLWPYSAFENVAAYFFDRRHLTTSPLGRLENDFGGTPYRHLMEYRPENASLFEAMSDDPFAAERIPPGIRRAEAAAGEQGFVAVMGTMAFKESFQGAFLMNYRGEILHHWPLAQDHPEWDMASNPRALPHGFDVRPNGDILINYDNGIPLLSRYSPCGEVRWNKDGHHHHAISANQDGTGWTLRYSDNLPDDVAARGALTIVTEFVHFDLATGKELNSFSLFDVMDANPGLDIFGLRQSDYYDHTEWAWDPFHVNDVEALAPAYADAFPQFSAGDLLISLRSVNLVFVLDPETLSVEWWRIGQARRQHDPDWQPDGTISIYDNQRHRAHSRIVEIDPRSYEARVLVDGKAFDFTSPIRGRHQIKENGNVLIVSPEQGRVFEVTADGRLVFDLINRYDDEAGLNLVVMDAVYLPAGYLDLAALEACRE